MVKNMGEGLYSYKELEDKLKGKGVEFKKGNLREGDIELLIRGALKGLIHIDREVGLKYYDDINEVIIRKKLSSIYGQYSLTTKSKRILLNYAIKEKEYEIIRTMYHEYGHHIHYSIQNYKGQYQKVWEDIGYYKAWEDYYAKLKGRGTLKRLEEKLKGSKEKEEREYYEYVLIEDEVFARLFEQMMLKSDKMVQSGYKETELSYSDSELNGFKKLLREQHEAIEQGYKEVENI